MDNMTALVSCFARAYHYKNSKRHVFADSFAEQMLTPEEYSAISQNMAQGIQFFMPGFHGTQEEVLQFIVDHQLAPSVLSRSAFCERAIDNAGLLGCRQVVIYACGYDTFSLRTNNQALTVYELDRPEMIADRRKRIARAGTRPVCRVDSIGCDLAQPSWKEKLIQAGFDEKMTSFGSLLGISYYLSKPDFRNFITAIASIFCEGSSICFDYPVSEEGAESQRSRELAAAAGEMMKAEYSFEEMEALLSDTGFLICEHMDAGQATDAFLKDSGMTAPAGVGYCLAVRKEGLRMVLETQRLMLREMKPDDFQALSRVLGDPETMWHYPYTFDGQHVRDWIERNIKRYQKDGFGLWAVCLKQSGEMIGDCGLTMQNINGKTLPEIGYHIRRDCQRKGYASEAARAVLDWAFCSTDFKVLYSYCKFTNIPSIKTAESIGMHFVCEYPDETNGTTHVSAVSRKEWLNEITEIN